MEVCLLETIGMERDFKKAHCYSDTAADCEKSQTFFSIIFRYARRIGVVKSKRFRVSHLRTVSMQTLALW